MTGAASRAGAPHEHEVQAAEQEAVLPAATGAGGRLPDFFLVGHSKSGTTALYEMLGAHPGVFMPAVKEPTYFASDLRPRSPREGEPQRLEDYLALFEQAPPGSLVGEASSLYLYSRDAPAAIARALPRARIVALLREPADFLRSLHLQLLQNGIETERDLGRALALEPERSRGERIPRGCYRPQALLYSERVRYVEQLRRYHEAFPPEQVLVLIYEDFREDNSGTLARVLGFLGLEEGVELEPSRANPSVQLRSVRLAAARRRLSIPGGALSRTLALAERTAVGRAARRSLAGAVRGVLYREPSPPEERVMAELRARLRPEVESLGEYLGRDMLARWGYDGPR